MSYATIITSRKLWFESVMHLAPKIFESWIRNRANFREKTRERVANFVRFRCTGLAWRALRALHNTHGVSEALGRDIAAFCNEIAQ